MGFFIRKFERYAKEEMLQNITPNIAIFAFPKTKNTLYQ